MSNSREEEHDEIRSLLAVSLKEDDYAVWSEEDLAAARRAATE